MSYTPWIVELSIALHSRNSFLHYALKLTVFCAKREEKVKQRGALGKGGKKFAGRRQRKKGRLGAFPGSSSPRRRLLYRPKKGLLLHLTRPLPFNLPSPNPSGRKFVISLLNAYVFSWLPVVCGFGLHLEIFNTCLFLTGIVLRHLKSQFNWVLSSLRR